MKKLFSFCTFLLFAFQLLAQNTSNLTISTTGSSNLKIMLGNKKYSLQDRSVTFQSLTPGNYKLTIFQLQKKAGGGTEYANVFDKTITLIADKHMEVTVMRFGRTAWDESFIERDDWNENYNNPRPSDQYDNNNGYNNGNNWRIANAVEFANVKKALANEYNEEERLKLSRIIFKNNWFSVVQIKEIAQTFYNEGRKLTFLKFAYDFCADKGNYYSIAETFYSSVTKREFITFLEGR